LFTALFVGDIPGMQGSPAFDGGPAEPITALTAISQHTKHVGLIATASTTFYDPYNLAWLLASWTRPATDVPGTTRSPR
jgi:alkanesulfonate monooxygenase SsuD/methylene tetrahydromethanopterin reductase-like flavin-dependent oxidoreductase (luciferase family)